MARFFRRARREKPLPEEAEVTAAQEQAEADEAEAKAEEAAAARQPVEAQAPEGIAQTAPAESAGLAEAVKAQAEMESAEAAREDLVREDLGRIGEGAQPGWMESQEAAREKLEQMGAPGMDLGADMEDLSGRLSERLEGLRGLNIEGREGLGGLKPPGSNEPDSDFALETKSYLHGDDLSSRPKGGDPRLATDGGGSSPADAAWTRAQGNMGSAASAQSHDAEEETDGFAGVSAKELTKDLPDQGSPELNAIERVKIAQQLGQDPDPADQAVVDRLATELADSGDGSEEKPEPPPEESRPTEDLRGGGGGGPPADEKDGTMGGGDPEPGVTRSLEDRPPVEGVAKAPLERASPYAQPLPDQGEGEEDEELTTMLDRRQTKELEPETVGPDPIPDWQAEVAGGGGSGGPGAPEPGSEGPPEGPDEGIEEDLDADLI